MLESVPQKLPVWISARVELRPLRAGDLDFLYSSSIAPENSFRWRYRGAVPDPAEFSSQINAGVLIQLMVVKRRAQQPVGLVTCYNANHRDGYAYLSALSGPAFLNTGLVMDGVILMIDYLFLVWPLRKLYFESLEFSVSSYGSALGPVIVEEGRLRDHTFFGGRWWDLITSAIYRDDWESLRSDGDSRFTASRIRGGSASAVSENTDMDIDTFCQLLAETVPSPRGIEAFNPEHLLQGDLGYDSVHVLEIVGLMDELAGLTMSEWPEHLKSVRDLYLWYCTASSLPRDRTE
jgi:RimJ/RimL family protein N-acetyltransferase